MNRILDGISKFRNVIFHEKQPLFEQLALKQNPQALFIACADSRVVPDLITQSDPGDLFICRNAGNMVPPYGELHGGVSATIEYAVRALDVEHIIVCGHTDCGAMKGLLHPEKVESMPTVKSWLFHGESARRVVTENYPRLSEEALLNVLTEENVVAQLQHLRTHPSVAARAAAGKLSLHGWVYHIRTGDIDAWDSERTRFIPIDQWQPAAVEPRSRLAVAR